MGDEPVPYKQFHTLVLSQENGETGVSLAAAEDETEFILVSGMCLLHPRVIV